MNISFESAPDAHLPNQEYGLDDRINIGIHKGKTIRQILKDAPKWLQWAKGEPLCLKYNCKVRAELEEILDNPYRDDVDSQRYGDLYNDLSYGDE